MDMKTLKCEQMHDQIDHKCKDIDYVLYHSNAWVSEKELSNSFFPILESYLASNLNVEVIKLEEVEQLAYKNSSIFPNADVPNVHQIMFTIVRKIG